MPAAAYAKTRRGLRGEIVCIRFKDSVEREHVRNSVVERLAAIQRLASSHHYVIAASTSEMLLRNERGTITDRGDEIIGDSSHLQDVAYMIQLVQCRGRGIIAIEGAPALTIPLIVEARMRGICVDGVGPYVVGSPQPSK